MAPKRNIVLGRSRDCDLVLSEPTVSGRHARLTWRDGRILVEDLGSANGTFVGKERIGQKAVRPGDDLRFGAYELAWSDPRLRPFLRAGASDTVQGVTIPGQRRFICGRCGTRGLMPGGFTSGVLKCGACGERLVVTGEKRRGVLRPLLTLAALVAVSTGAFLLFESDAAKETLERAAETLGEVPSQLEALDGAASPQEGSIRAHTLPAVLEALDVTSPTTRNTAARLAADDEGPYRVEQVARLWSHARSEWRYVNDPRGNEYFAKASETIENEYVGDCDDFAILLVAMIQAIGGDARLVMMDGPGGGHAYAEACVVGDAEEVRDKLRTHYRRNRDRNLGRQSVDAIHYRPSAECPVWLNLDWNAGVPGGPYEDEAWAVAIYADGRTETLAPAGRGELAEGEGEARGNRAANPP
ncbi:MAG: FHA domain-containing protein [Myxococcota bacterium]